MSEEIQVIRIPGPPVSKERPRVTKTGRAYTPKKTRDWEAMASQIIALERRRFARIERPIRVVICAAYARPKRRPRGVDAALWESGGYVPRPCRPDLDNVIKAVLDACQLSGALKDDSFVVEIHAYKAWARKGDGPAVMISFREVE